MGTEDPDGFAADGEGPVRAVTLKPFWIDAYAVANARFATFVEATGHVTDAERYGWSFVFGGLLPDDFEPTRGAAQAPWWRQVFGASWRHPEGPHSSIEDRMNHPVVHVSWSDAASYCAWAGTRLPTEAEWEYAARGGLEQAVFCWGDEFMPGGELMANTWHGEFPHQHDRPDPWLRTSPVKTYPPNGYGLADMAGNVWEWTDDFYSAADGEPPEHPCCVPRNPRVPAPVADSYRLDQPGARIPRRVTKGGSHLCAPNYCLRYRPAARQGEAVDTSTGHIGFRCVIRAE
jgi:formylglycine-generating enzyme